MPRGHSGKLEVLALWAASGSMKLLFKVSTMREILRAVRMTSMGAVGVTEAVSGDIFAVECHPRTCKRHGISSALLSGYNNMGLTNHEVVSDFSKGSGR